MFETGMGLIVVCMPSHYVLAQSLWKSWFPNDGDSSSSSGGGNTHHHNNNRTANKPAVESKRESQADGVGVSDSQRSLEGTARALISPDDSSTYAYTEYSLAA
jgi:hypothetical protein